MLFLCLATVTGLSFLAGIVFGLPTLLLVAVAAGIAQTVGKLALDATLQRDVAEEIRTAAFARAETVQQLAFVVGGAVGLLPLNAHVGLIGAGLVCALALLDMLRQLARSR